jgi:hypothetical protein
MRTEPRCARKNSNARRAVENGDIMRIDDTITRTMHRFHLFRAKPTVKTAKKELRNDCYGNKRCGRWVSFGTSKWTILKDF